MSGRLARCGAYFSDRSAGICTSCYGKGACRCEGCKKGLHRVNDPDLQRKAREAQSGRTNSDIFTGRPKQFHAPRSR